jgi:hypothetical protein
MSILDAATNDLVLLLNHLDLEATPGPPATDYITREAINAASTTDVTTPTTPTPTPKRTRTKKGKMDDPGSKASMTSLRLNSIGRLPLLRVK